MSIISKLYVDGKAYGVLDYRIDFHQEKDITGKPTGRIQGGLVHVTVEARMDTVFHHWAVAPAMMKDIEIVFSPVTRASNSRTIKLYDVHLSKISTYFTNQTTEPMKFSMVFSPGIFVDGDVIHKKPWHITDLESLAVEPTQEPEREEEPRVIDFYITDDKGKTKTKYKVGDFINIVIETINKEGETISINLKDKTKDFKYKGEILPNDILQDYVIQGRRDIIKMEVVAQQNH